MKVFRWIEVYKKPQLYTQVFLDDIYAIDVLDIMRVIGSSERLNIIEPKRSDKVTIMLPVSHGRLIGSVTRYPKLEVVDRTTASGRHDMFVKPSEGEITLAGNDLEEMLTREV